MRILLVEDNRRFSTTLKASLEEDGYAVDTAFDGEEGHFLASTNDYDVILLDLMIPKIDGVALCRRLREEGSRVPVIMLTARDSVKDKITGLDAGANDYLTKPSARFCARRRMPRRPR